MKLYLVRHGAASDDAERALSPEGIRQAEETARWAAEKNITVIQIRHSGKRRAEQTAGIIGKRIRVEKGLQAVSGLRPDDNPLEALEELEAEGLSSLMLVGHNPFMSILAHRLLSQDPGSPSSLTFHTGTIACFQKSGSVWRLNSNFTPRNS